LTIALEHVIILAFEVRDIMSHHKNITTKKSTDWLDDCKCSGEIVVG
jgi:hypothetical protein